MKIGILDFGGGNVQSVQNALERLECDFFLSGNPEELTKADKIIFPGVGHASAVMRTLRTQKLDVFLRETTKPVLGICLGMQLLFEFSEEGETEGIGIFAGKVRHFDPNQVSCIPHMGWNSVTFCSSEKEKEDFYFVHSYFCEPQNPEEIWGETIYEEQKFCSAVRRDNFHGVQFHPEKSGKGGERFLREFLKEDFSSEYGEELLNDPDAKETVFVAKTPEESRKFLESL